MAQGRDEGSGPEIVRTKADLRARCAGWGLENLSTGFVPTMGALHQGHLSLVRAALDQCHRVVVSVFVNPTQFGPNEDFDRYPRDEAADAAKLSSVGAHLLYIPDVSEMYPGAGETTIRVAGSRVEGLCAPFRPGYFDAVATVVVKLLLQIGPDRAYFGEKDWQQLQVVRQAVTDLDIPARIEAVETRREPDGLALSSRNAYLTPRERAHASDMFEALRNAAARVARCEAVPDIERTGKQRLEEAGFGPIDYFSVVDEETLSKSDDPRRPVRVAAAAWLGTTRLIDNVRADRPSELYGSSDAVSTDRIASTLDPTGAGHHQSEATSAGRRFVWT